MIPSTEAKQISLRDDGLICWQPDATNPLPGNPVARVVKGDAALAPRVEILPELPLVGEARDVAVAQLSDWLAAYITRVLEPLVKLGAVLDGTPPSVQTICDKVHAGLGIVPRADVMDAIAGLDTESRKTLRGRHIRLGPVLVFIPDLNKPAAVRLRALLWSLWHDQPLPAPVPRDGAVSQIVDPAGANPAFYQAIGYPLYANRAIRIDMLDRVMNAVYENVKDNQFQAKHQMAEWLGCSVPDLYVVLEAMGHRKVHDPADAVAATAAASASDLTQVIPTETGPAVEPTPAVDVPTTPVSDPVAVTDPAPPAEQNPAMDATTPAAKTARPELATFRVWWPRKGGAKPADGDGARRERGPRKPRKPFVARDGQNTDGATAAPIPDGTPHDTRPARKPFRKKFDRDGEKSDERGERKPGSGKPQNGPGRNVGGRPGQSRREPMTYGSVKKSKPNKLDKNLRMVANASAPAASGPAAKDQDNPFAALMQIKF